MDFATLDLVARTDQLTPGVVALDRLVDAGARAEGAAQGVERATGAMGKGVQRATTATEMLNQSITGTAPGLRAVEQATGGVEAALRDVEEAAKRTAAGLSLVAYGAAESNAALMASIRGTGAASTSYSALQESIQRVVGSYAGLRTEFASAEASAAAMGSEMDALRAKYNPLFAASKAYEEELGEIARAERLGAISAMEAAQARDRAARGFAAPVVPMRAMAAATQEVSAAARGFDTRMMAMQLSQVAQQGSATGNYLQALAIQLPDLALGLGTVGIAAGVAAGVLLPLAANLFRAGDGAAEAEGALDAFKAALTDIQSYSEIARATINDLRETFGEFAEDAKATAEAVVRASTIIALEAIKPAIDEAKAGLSDLMAINEELYAAEANLAANEDPAFQATSEQLQVMRDNVEGLREEAWAAAAALGLMPEEAGALLASLDRIKEQGSMDAIAQGAFDAIAGISALYDEGEKMPPLLAQIVDGIKDIAYDTAEAATAAGPLILTVEDGRDAAEQFADRWRDVTAAIAEARAEAGLFGSAINEVKGFMAGLAGAAGDFMASFAPDGAMATTLSGLTDGAVAADRLLREMENPNGPWLTPHMDRKSNGEEDRLRIGYSSDTVTLSDGTVQDVVAGMTVSIADANRDLTRRIAEGQLEIAGQIGAARWAELLPAQQAVLSSLEYNFGRLPDSVAEAVRSGAGDATVVAAIRSLSANPTRRAEEAAIYASASMGDYGNAAGIAAQTQAERDAAEAIRERDQATREADQAAKEAARQREQDVEAYDAYIASLSGGLAIQAEYAQAIETITAAEDAGRINAQEEAKQLEEALLRYNEAAAALTELDPNAAALGNTVGALAERFTGSAEEADAFRKALAGAGMSAAELGTAKASILIGGIDGMADAWGDFVAGGLRDFDGFVDAILGSFQSMLAQMVSLAGRNQIMISLGMGAPGAVAGAIPTAAGGALGGVGALIGGMGSGAGAVISGVMTNGLAGGSAVLSSALTQSTASMAAFGSAIGALAVPVGAALLLFQAFKSTTTELDAGLRVTIDGMDALVESFSKVETSRFFGLSTSTSTDYDQASAEAAAPILKAYDKIRTSVTDMAAIIGVGADAFEGFAHTVTVSTKDMTDEQAAEAVAAALGEVGDAMALLALDGQFVRAGETASQSLERVSTAFATVEASLATLGYSLSTTFTDSVRAAQEMTDALGGSDAFAQAANLYFQTTYSVQEQIDEARRQLREGLDSADVSRGIPETTEDLRDLVDDLLSAGRAADAATIIGLTPLFNALEDLEEQSAAAAEAAAAEARAKADAIAAEGDALQMQLWQMEGSREALDQIRKAELMALDESNRELQHRIYLLEDEAAAAAEAQAVADERLGLERRYYEAVGDTASLAALARAEIDGANLAYYDTVVAAEAAAGALAEAQAAMEALDPSDFVSRFDFERAQGLAANSLGAPSGVMPMPLPPNVVPFPTPAPTPTEDALLRELKAFREESRSSQMTISSHTKRIADLEEKWDEEGTPAVRAS